MRDSKRPRRTVVIRRWSGRKGKQRKALMLLVLLIVVTFVLYCVFGRYTNKQVLSTLGGSSNASSPERLPLPSRHVSSLSMKPSAAETLQRLPSMPTDVLRRTAPEYKMKMSTEKPQCWLDRPCGHGRVAFNVTTGYNLVKPIFCINDAVIADQPVFKIGIAVVVVQKSGSVLNRYFDLSNNRDTDFYNYLTQKIEPTDIAILASFSDISTRLSPDTRDALSKFGASRAPSLQEGQDFLLVGQRGVQGEAAFERVGIVSEQNTDALISISGCFQMPLGQQHQVQFPTIPVDGFEKQKDSRRVAGQLQFGSELRNCGLQSPCREDEASVWFYSGANKDDQVKMCFNNRLVFDKNLNDAGRGLNVAVLNVTTRTVLRTGHFDTYADSTQLEIFLIDLAEDEIIAIITFDEAYSHLSHLSKQQFYELGSSMIQNLKFRGAWMFVGQKGMKGFTAFEALRYPDSSNAWAPPIDEKFCLPSRLHSTTIPRPDESQHSKNQKRRSFCLNHSSGYGDFCSAQSVDEPLSPEPIADLKARKNPIFSVPILVIAALSHKSLQLTLDSLRQQPGIILANVLVSYDHNYPESAEVAELYGVRSVATPSHVRTYGEHVEAAFDALWSTYPNADTVIFIDEDVLLSVGFMEYMMELYPLLHSSTHVASVAAWNPNGFVDVSSRPDLAYLVEAADVFPTVTFMLRRDFYETYLRGNFSVCCTNFPWHSWSIPREFHVIVPDVSRVLCRHRLVMSANAVTSYFGRPREYNRHAGVRLSNIQALQTLTAYDAEMKGLKRSAVDITTPVVELCNNLTYLTSDGSSIPVRRYIESSLTINSHMTYSIKYSNSKQLSILSECFGLYFDKPIGVYKGTLRFSYAKSVFLLIKRSVKT